MADPVIDSLVEEMTAKLIFSLEACQQLKDQGNTLFKLEQFEDAIAKYNEALDLFPPEEPASQPQAIPEEQPPQEDAQQAESSASSSESQSPVETEVKESKPVVPLSPETVLKAQLHNNIAACWMKLAKYEEAIAECTEAIRIDGTYLKALTRRADAYETVEKYALAVKDWDDILAMDVDSRTRANIAKRDKLKKTADEIMEREKAELLGKLKDMGNSILGKFGLSTDNFKFTKDPNSGGYSMSFQR